MIAQSELLVFDDGPVRHLRFNRPERLNALDLPQHERVLQALHEARDDQQVRVVVFSGVGRAFCAGDDLKGGGGPTGWPTRYAPRLVDLEHGIGPLLLQEVTSFLREFPKPTAALVHGHALGAGYDYATSCDFRLAVEDCNFGDPRIRLAIWLAEGWSYKLPRLVHFGRVPRIAYLGEGLNGNEALAIGLVHRLYAAGTDLTAATREFLLRLASMPLDTYASTKQKLLRDLDLPFRAVTQTG